MPRSLRSPGMGVFEDLCDLDPLELSQPGKGCLGGRNVGAAPEEDARPSEELVAHERGHELGDRG